MAGTIVKPKGIARNFEITILSYKHGCQYTISQTHDQLYPVLNLMMLIKVTK